LAERHPQTAMAVLEAASEAYDAVIT